jgi:alpha-galactosidase
LTAVNVSERTNWRFVGRGEEGLEQYERVKRELAAGTPLEIERSWEYASLIINSMETGEPCVIYGNVRNTGLITNLPADVCVEVPCVVDRTGVNPTYVGDVAPQCAALNRTFANVCDLTVRAVLDGRIDHVRHAAMLDPNTAASLTLDGIDALVDEMLDAYRDYLPESLR